MPPRPSTKPLRVTADSLAPAQMPTPLALRRAADYYRQYGVKYPGCGSYHSYPEFLHAGLAEGTPSVTSYIPQPLRLRVSRTLYTPDCYVVDAGTVRIVELKPRGEFDTARREALTTFFALHRMQFEVIANETVLAREIEALNWWHVVRTLHSGRDLPTAELEAQLLQRILAAGNQALGDLLDNGDRRGGMAREIALYRLLHCGLARPDWRGRRLGPDTEIAACS